MMYHIIGLVLAIIVFLIFILTRMSTRIPVLTFIVLFFVAMGAYVYGDAELANNISLVVFYLMVVSVVIIIIDYVRDYRKKVKPEKTQEEKEEE